MKWQDVIAKHWKGIEEAAEKALISIERELRECYLSQQFDDDLKQYLLCRTQNGVAAVYNKFVCTIELEKIQVKQEDTVNSSGIPKVHMAIDSADSDIEINENIDSLELSIGNQNLDDQQLDAANLNGENDVKPFVKDESIAVSAIEMADIPVVAFDPNKNNESADAANEEGESSKIRRSNPPSNVVIKRLKHCGGKRHKCEHCQRFFPSKSKLKRHQPVHANGKLIGVRADSNGLYHCTHCFRIFTNVNHLSKHTKLHKDNQYLYYCVRCMRPFDQEAEKDSHENQCEGRHFECHLCKVYVSTYKSKMQIHMRTHSGAKPSRCMVCDKSFQTKCSLRRHLNTIHGRIMS